MRSQILRIVLDKRDIRKVELLSFVCLLNARKFWWITRRS